MNRIIRKVSACEYPCKVLPGTVVHAPDNNPKAAVATIMV
jgi:hypothetical protein